MWNGHYFTTIITINIYKEGDVNMNKFKMPTVINMLGMCLIAFAGIISSTACLGLLGEIDPPMSLLDK